MDDFYAEQEYLEHYGIKGMKWGIRRFQNSDGTLTSAGKKRYSTDVSSKVLINKTDREGLQSASSKRKEQTQPSSTSNVHKRGDGLGTSPVGPIYGRDSDFKPIHVGPGSFDRPSSGSVIGGSTKEVSDVLTVDYGDHTRDIKITFPEGKDIDELRELVLDALNGESSAGTFISDFINQKNIDELTVDLSGYRPGAPYTLFKEFQGADAAEDYFPELQSINDPRLDMIEGEESRMPVDINDAISRRENAMKRRDAYKKELKAIDSQPVNSPSDAKKHVYERKRLQTLIDETAEEIVFYTRKVKAFEDKAKTASKLRNNPVMLNPGDLIDHDAFYDDDYLEHHGIKGMRWGIRRTPEQLGHYIEKQRKKMTTNVRKAQEAKRSGDVKTLKKLNAKTSKYIANIEKAKKMLPDREKEYSQYQQEQEAARQKKAADKAIKEQRKADKAEAKRQEFLNTADSEELYKHRHEYSADEISRAIKRIQTEQTLDALKSTKEQLKLDNTKQRISKMAAIGESAVSAFGTYQKMASTINKITGEDTLPDFDREGAKKKEKEKKEKESKAKVDKLVKTLDINAVLKDRDKLTADEMKKALSEISSSTSQIASYYKSKNETANSKKQMADRDRKEQERVDAENAKAAADKAKQARKLADLAFELSQSRSDFETAWNNFSSETYTTSGKTRNVDKSKMSEGKAKDIFPVLVPNSAKEATAIQAELRKLRLANQFSNENMPMSLTTVNASMESSGDSSYYSTARAMVDAYVALEDYTATGGNWYKK